MKYFKKASVGLIAGLLVMSGQSASFASGNVEESKTPVQEQTEQEEITLTLDQVKEMLLANNSNLIIMETNIAKMKYQRGKIVRDQRETEDDIDEVNEARDQGATGLGQMKGGLLDKRYGLEEAYEQIENGLVITDLTKQQAKDALQLQAAIVYTALLDMQDQMKLLEESVELAKKDVKAARLREHYGVAAAFDTLKLQQELETRGKSLKDLKTAYDLQMTKLNIDLNLPLEQKVSLQPIELMEIGEIELPEDIDKLIENSYNMKTAQEELSLLNYYAVAKDTLFEKNQNEYDIKSKKQEIVKLENDLRKAITTAYDDVNQAYLEVNIAQSKLDFAKKDYRQLQVKYELGFVSKVDFDKASLLVTQAEQALSSAFNKYVKATENVKAVENGLVQVQ